MECWIIVSFFRSELAFAYEAALPKMCPGCGKLRWRRPQRAMGPMTVFVLFCFPQKPIKKKKMLTLLTFHKDESCLSLGTAVPAKKLLIRFPFTGEAESGLSGGFSHLSDRQPVLGLPQL